MIAEPGEAIADQGSWDATNHRLGGSCILNPFHTYAVAASAASLQAFDKAKPTTSSEGLVERPQDFGGGPHVPIGVSP